MKVFTDFPVSIGLILCAPSGRSRRSCAYESGRYDGRSMTVKAVIHKAEEGGFWAEVPALPGCVTQGETMDDLRSNLMDAIKLWLEAGEPV